MADKLREDLHRCLLRARRNRKNFVVDLNETSMEIMKEFDITNKKRMKLMEFLQKSVEATKNKEFLKHVEPEYPRIVRKNTAHQDMLNFAGGLPTVAMTKYTERDILRRINAKRMENNFPEVLASVMKDVKEEFLEVTHEVSLWCSWSNLV